VANHLSHLQFEEFVELPINDYLKDDTLLKVSTVNPWYANIVNYIVLATFHRGVIRKRLSKTT
jgi:hypothetical protein